MKQTIGKWASRQIATVAKALANAKVRNLDPVRLIVASAILLSACAAIGTGLYLVDLRNRAIADQERSLANTALIVAKQIEHIFTTVESVQGDIIARAVDAGKAGQDSFERQLASFDNYVKLRDKAAGMPYVGSLTIMSPQGRLINFSRRWPTPSIDASARDYIKPLQSDSHLVNFIGEPVRNYSNGSWVVHQVSKIVGADGEFLGLTSAAIELQYLQDSFAQIVFQPGSGISLFRSDGTLLARIPRVESEIGARMPQVISLKLVADSDQGVGISGGVIDGIVRIVAAHRVGKYPMVIATTKTVAAALADWRQTAKYGLITCALIILITMAFAVLFIKLVRNYQALVNARAERMNAEALRVKSLQLDVALNTMSQGLAMFDASERIILCNRRYIEMYDLPEEFVVPGRSLRELLQMRQMLGSFPRDIEQYRDELLNDLSRDKTRNVLITNSAGRSHRVITVPMADGGWVGTHEDVTEKVRADKVREQQKHQLDAALEHMSQGLCMFDGSQRLVACNKKYAEIYGLSDAQTKPGTTLREILESRIAVGSSTEDRERYVKDRLDEVTKNEPYQVTNRLRDGRYVSVVHRPLAKGGWVATHEDVTEANCREESFRLLFEGSPIPMWVLNRESLRFLAVNDATIAHYGYSREEFMSMGASDLRPAEDRARFEECLRGQTADQIADRIGQHVKADGTPIDVEVYSKSLTYEKDSRPG
jgi:PAS domain S-box-containing protein